MDLDVKRLTITKLTSKGIGSSCWKREDGSERQVEVPYTLPQEVVDVEVGRRRRKGALPGRLKNIVTPSPLRVIPRCIHFTSCGGCSLQHLLYEEQVMYKQAFVYGLFQTASFQTKEQLSASQFHPIVQSIDPWHYRNKMEYTFSQNRAGEKFLGLILAQSRGYVFHLQECHLVDSWFAKTVVAIRKWWQESTLSAYNYNDNSGSLRTLTLRHGITSGDRMVMITVSGNPDYALKQHDLNTLVELMKALFPDLQLSIVLRIQQIAKGSPTQFYEMMLFGPDYVREEVQIGQKKLEFHISPSAFFQPNTRTAEKLYARAIELAEITSDDVVYDLYCGIGVFGMCAAQVAKEVIAIELSREAAYDAKTNSQRLGITNFTIYPGDVAHVLKEKRDILPKADVVIVDPPRSGLTQDAIIEIMTILPKTIVYVSCNPVTQAENVLAFMQFGYSITHVQPVDQFPHTPHVENILICRR